MLVLSDLFCYAFKKTPRKGRQSDVLISLINNKNVHRITKSTEVMNIAYFNDMPLVGFSFGRPHYHSAVCENMIVKDCNVALVHDL